MTGILMLVCCSFSMTLFGYCVEKDTYDTSRPLKVVLEELEEEYSMFFSYEKMMVENIGVDFNLIKEEELESAMNRLLTPLDLNYELFGDKYIVIYSKSEEGDRDINKIKDHLKEISKIESKGLVKISRASTNNLENLENTDLLLPGLVTKETITGKVISSSGEPLIGATIIVKGTSIGTQSDIDGNFTLENVGESEVLEVSYIGFVSKTIPLNGRKYIEIILDTDAKVMDEVVVIGYTSVAKKDVTGAVASLSNENFNKGIVSSPEQLIQGKLPGVQVTTDGGEPGGGVNVNIRGAATIASNSNPLYVVNGIPLNGVAVSPVGVNIGTNDNGLGNASARNPLTFLNPNDIQTIDILKDASATAIYGSRGANGVVIITTKKGRSASEGIEVSTFAGVSTVTNTLDVLSAEEYAAVLPGNDEGARNDYQDLIFRPALSVGHNLSYGGKTADGNSTFQVSGGYNRQDGVVEASGQTRYMGSFNSSSTLLNDKLKLNMFAVGANILDDNPQISNDAGAFGDLLSTAWRVNPTRPLYQADGVTYNQPSDSELNPAAVLGLSTDKTNTIRVLSGINATFSVLKNLDYKFNMGANISTSKRRSALSRDLNRIRVADLGIATFSDVQTTDKVIEHTLNYKKNIGDNNLNVLVGYSWQSFQNRGSVLQATGFNTSDLDMMINNVESANFTVPNSGVAGSYSEIDELQSFFGRVNYSINSKYIFTGTLRADGSSKFGENNRYGYFPSAAFAWRLSNEDFIGDVFYDLKLRMGYGITGNQEFPGGSQLNLRRFQNPNAILTAPRFANPNLKWEESRQFNVGIDYAVLEGKVRGTVDVYSKNTTDLLIPLPSPAPAPSAIFFGNLDANIKNTGVEFGISADLVNRPNFNWTPTLNIAFNDNVIENMDDFILTGAISGPGLTGATAQAITGGQPLFSYYMEEFTGFDDDGNSIVAEGGASFVGKSPLPKYNYGISNSLQFGNLDLNVFIMGQGGHYIYNNNGNAFFYKAALETSGLNVTEEVADNSESAGNGNGVSTRWLEKGDFLRLQNATLGYNINTGNNKYINSLRLTLTGQNLLTITGYSGQDPEVNVDKSIGGIPSRGIDYTAYPRAKTVTLGLSVKLK